MLDFMRIGEEVVRKNKIDSIRIFPEFIVCRSKDLMIRGGDFYAIWIEEQHKWSRDEQDAIDLIDKELNDFYNERKDKYEVRATVQYVRNAKNGIIDQWHKYCQRQMRDSYHLLDQKLIFSNMTAEKDDYSSTQLSYPLEDGPHDAYDKLMQTLYSPEELKKIEWSIGSIVAGASTEVQKFVVLYGGYGTGKSTALDIVKALFDGYYNVFNAKALGSTSGTFSLEPFKDSPLVALQYDGDLSKIEDNIRLNSLISHEEMVVNTKYGKLYSQEFSSFLFMGTNKPVKITDSKSGIIRRLLDVSPTGNRVPRKEYLQLMSRIKFELSGIAWHCKQVFEKDPDYYDDYIPLNMIAETNDLYDFVFEYYDTFAERDSITLSGAWEMYKEFCDYAAIKYPLSRRKFMTELKSYFKEHKERAVTPDGTRVRNYYTGFLKNKFRMELPEDSDERSPRLMMSSTKSLLDKDLKDMPAQYAKEDGSPRRKWENVKTTLKSIDTTKLHFVKMPENHIVIDFDLKDEHGNKDLDKNLKAAAKFPATYAEISKSGAGVHLHYIYNGDVSKLSRVYSEGIEVKVYTGNSSLRRKLTKCNDIPIATINSGLPLKEEEGVDVISEKVVKSEKSLRNMIQRNLNKEIHANTAPSVNFIKKILDDAYASGMTYDVSDMRNAILAFAASSTNQANHCINEAMSMKYKSADNEDKEAESRPDDRDDTDLIFFDCEVFPNLLLVNWKVYKAAGPCTRMVNPTPEAVEELVRTHRLVGFNNLRYDNHILYARIMGYNNEQIYRESQRLINGDKNATFMEARHISYTDVYDFSSKKQSLKKWEIELGIHHQELGLPWDEPVPESEWEKVAEYCDNDVISTEAVFENLKDTDWLTRRILADLADGSVNDTSNQLSTKIIFGNERHPELVYTDMATGEASNPKYQQKKYVNAFPGYEFVNGHNMFRGVDVSMGGYVYSEPGIYHNVALLDVESLHPHSAIALNYFGSYTKRYSDLVDMRIDLKHGEVDKAMTLFNGKLKKWLNDPNVSSKALSKALKVPINSVYGLSSASFDNAFRDNRNKNNIIALRGALFMKTLQDEVAKRGFTVAHIKTDSIKIPNATPEIISFCMEFAKRYGYTFDHEATYSKMCLVNDAVYIAKKDDGEWTATGTQFSVPYVFKTLFSHEPIEFNDVCETKSVKTAIYLDMNEGIEDNGEAEKERDWREKQYKKNGKPVDHIIFQNPTFKNFPDEELEKTIQAHHNYKFIGRVGQFCPIKKGCGGGLLVRLQGDKMNAVTGTKGYRWLESEVVRNTGKEGDVDTSYYRKLVDKAVDTIAQFGDANEFMEG